jgi:hypothetical protein
VTVRLDCGHFLLRAAAMASNQAPTANLLIEPRGLNARAYSGDRKAPGASVLVPD